MSSSFLLKNAGGFEQWRRAIAERAAQLLTDDLLEVENDDAPDPSLEIQRPKPLKDESTTQEIALWEARERQFLVVHSRIQQLLEYMVNLLEPTLYERVITINNFKTRTPTHLYRAVKKTLNPSSKSAETDLQTRLAKLERSSKTSDIDIWLNSWIQIENIAKSSRYSWANEIIDRFHAALGHRSIFFATSFAAHVWMGSITLSELAEQYRLCESKLKRFEYIGSQDLQNVFNPPVSLLSEDQNINTKKYTEILKDEKSVRCACGIKSHTIKSCFLFNAKSRPEKWVDRRPMFAKKKLYNVLKDFGKRRSIEKELGHKIPSELLDDPKDTFTSAATSSENTDLHDDYITESSPHSSYILALTASQTSLPYKNWWVFDSGSGRHICHQKSMFWTLKMTKTPQVITTGAGNCQIEGVGSILLQVNTPSGLSTLKIEEVLYVPKFMANIVSMDRIRDQMLIWDHSDNWLTRWDSERSPVIKIWNQYNQNFIAKEALPPKQTSFVTGIPETISIDLVHQDSVFSVNSTTLRRVSSADVVVWHRRLGHPGPKTIKKLNNAVAGIKVTGSYDGECEGCLLSKSKRIISRVPADKGDNYWTRMHVDLIIFQQAWNGDKYALHAYDAKGRGHLVETLSVKDQLTLSRSIMNMIQILKKEGRIIKFLHGDNEKGFGPQFRQMLQSEGIKFENTVPYTPEQNGFAESSGNRICVVARTLRIHSGFPENLWPELVKTAVYLLNRTPNEGINWTTPFEQYEGRKPDISNLKIIGCRAFVHIPREKRLASAKLAERAWIGYLIGFEAHNIWRIWNPASGEVVRVRDVIFQENRLFHDDRNDLEVPIEVSQFPRNAISAEINFLNPRLNRWNTQQDEITLSENIESKSEDRLKIPENSDRVYKEVPSNSKQDPSKNYKFDIPGKFPLLMKEKNTLTNTAPRTHEISSDLSVDNIITGARSRNPKNYDTPAMVYKEPEEDDGYILGEPFFSCLANSITTDRFDGKINRFDNSDTDNDQKLSEKTDRLSKDPCSWKQMQKHQDRSQFMIAAETEFQGLQNRHAWEVIDINEVAEKSKIFPMRWVFISKKDGDLVKHKARVVIRGDLDETPYCRDEIYSHTLSLQHFRSIMAFINAKDMETLSFDAVQAFVNARRDKPIYCYMPEGFRQRGKVLRVWQALYGHRQSPKDWFNCYTNALKSLNFKSVNEEQCLWVHENGIILFFYVDDSIIAFDKRYEKEALELQQKIGDLFPIKKLGEAKSFVGIKIIRDREKRKMWLVQEGYMDNIKKSFNIKENGKTMSPLAPDYDMSPNKGERLNAGEIQIYQRKVGTALYAAICTRPDIALAVSMCADHLLNPAVRHQHAITHVLQYLVKTSKIGISYDNTIIKPAGPNPDVVIMASDASFGDAEGRRSSQGFVAFLYGGPVLWHASKQRSVTTSTTEAELVALSAAARELMALERFLNYLDMTSILSKKLLCDNQQTVNILTQKSPLLTTKLRHIDIHQHWLREKIQNNLKHNIELSWIPTSQMPADGLTKRLHIAKHHEFVRLIGLESTK